jgi:hypothetical protein
MGSGRRGAAGAFSVVCGSHRAQWGFWVRPAKGLGSRERLRLGLMGGGGVLEAPADELGQRWGLLDDSPSLRPQAATVLEQRYPRARRRAMGETKLPETLFPQTCPWTTAQLLDDDFWPEREPHQ